MIKISPTIRATQMPTTPRDVLKLKRRLNGTEIKYIPMTNPTVATFCLPTPLIMPY
jgi:hypothetical protein